MNPSVPVVVRSRVVVAFLTAVAAALAVIAPAQVAAAAVAITPGVDFTVTQPDDLSFSEFSFRAEAGQRPSVQVVSGPVTTWLVYEITGDQGQQVTERGTYGRTAVFPPMPGSGVFVLRVRYPDPITFTARLGLTSDVTQPLSEGVSTTVGPSGIGQRTELTFAAVQGDALRVGFSGLKLTGTAPGMDATLIDPMGIASGDPTDVTEGGDLLRTLDSSGTWRLRLTPREDTLGTVDVLSSLRRSPVRAITPGSAQSVSYAGDGLGLQLTFPARPGQRIVLGVTASDLTSPDGAAVVTATLLDPAGAARGGPNFLSGQAWVEWDPHVVDVAGTWSIVLSPVGATAGSQTLKVGVVSDRTTTATLGTPLTVGTTTPGRRIDVRFRATAGSRLVFELASVKFTAGSWGGTEQPGIVGDVIGPDGGYLAPGLSPGGTFGEYGEVPQTGTYTLRIDPVADTVGSARLTVRLSRTVTKSLTLGAATTATLTAGDAARYTFTGAAGRRLGLQLTTIAVDPGGLVELTLLRPDGSQFWSRLGTEPEFLETEPLDVAGTWSLVLDGLGSTAGTVGFTARQPVDLQQAITMDTEVRVAVRTPGQRVRLTFAGVAGRRPTIDSWFSSVKDATTGERSGATYSLYRPDGSYFQGFEFVERPETDDAFGELVDFRRGTLDVTGTWTLVVDPMGAATGSQLITVHQLIDPRRTLTLGTPVTVNLPVRGSQAEYSFRWNGQGPLDWTAPGTFLSAELTLTSPDGETQTTSINREESTRGEFRGNGTAGTWKVRVDPLSINTGTATLTLTPR